MSNTVTAVYALDTGASFNAKDAAKLDADVLFKADEATTITLEDSGAAITTTLKKKIDVLQLSPGTQLGPSSATPADNCPTWARVAQPNSNSDGWGQTVAVNSTHNRICVAGNVLAGQSPNTSIYVACYDKCGNLMASKLLDNQIGSVGGIAFGSDETLYVAGAQVVEPGGGDKAFVKRFNLGLGSMTESWGKYLEADFGSDYDAVMHDSRGKDLAVDSSGNIFVLWSWPGFSINNGKELRGPLCLSKYSSNGNLLDKQCYAFSSKSSIVKKVIPEKITIDSVGKIYTITTVAMGNGKILFVSRINGPDFESDTSFNSGKAFQLFNFGSESQAELNNDEKGDQGNAIRFKNAYNAVAGSPSLVTYAVGQGKPSGQSKYGLWIGFSSGASPPPLTTLVAPGDSFSYEMRAEDIDTDPYGNIYVVGTADLASGAKFVIRKYSAYPAYVSQWTKTFSAGAGGGGRGIAVASNALYVTGRKDQKLWLKKCPLSGCE